MSDALSSKWDGLNANLIARFYVAEPASVVNVRSYRISADHPAVHAPISDAVVETTHNWEAPFSGNHAGAIAPTISGMLQSGDATGVLSALSKRFGDEKNAGAFQAAMGTAAAQAGALRGATSVTKLNSTQVYMGSHPTRITLTAHFRAYEDPVSEVEMPVLQLLQYAAPQFLAEDCAFATLLAERKFSGVLRDIYPSTGPRVVALSYSGSLYMPMVITAISRPLNTPRDEFGRQVQCQLQMTLESLTALDARDVFSGSAYSQ